MIFQTDYIWCANPWCVVHPRDSYSRLQFCHSINISIQALEKLSSTSVWWSWGYGFRSCRHVWLSMRGLKLHWLSRLQSTVGNVQWDLSVRAEMMIDVPADAIGLRLSPCRHFLSAKRDGIVNPEGKHEYQSRSTLHEQCAFTKSLWSRFLSFVKRVSTPCSDHWLLLTSTEFRCSSWRYAIWCPLCSSRR